MMRCVSLRQGNSFKKGKDEKNGDRLVAVFIFIIPCFTLFLHKIIWDIKNGMSSEMFFI